MTSTMFALAFALLVAQLCLGEDFKHEHVKVLTDSNFKEQIDGQQITFIKFYAPWCGHCKKLAPTWAELGEEFSDDNEVVIAQMDCTANKDSCGKHDVKSYPTLMAFHNGKMMKQYKGPRDSDSLIDWVDDLADELLGDDTEETEM